MAIMINVDGSTKFVRPSNEKFTLQELQSLVGGNIEKLKTEHSCFVFDENGLNKGLKENKLASAYVAAEKPGLSSQTLVGVVLMCDLDEVN